MSLYLISLLLLTVASTQEDVCVQNTDICECDLYSDDCFSVCCETGAHCNFVNATYKTCQRCEDCDPTFNKCDIWCAPTVAPSSPVTTYLQSSRFPSLAPTLPNPNGTVSDTGTTLTVITGTDIITRTDATTAPYLLSPVVAIVVLTLFCTVLCIILYFCPRLCKSEKMEVVDVNINGQSFRRTAAARVQKKRKAGGRKSEVANPVKKKKRFSRKEVAAPPMKIVYHSDNELDIPRRKQTAASQVSICPSEGLYRDFAYSRAEGELTDTAGKTCQDEKASEDYASGTRLGPTPYADTDRRRISSSAVHGPTSRKAGNRKRFVSHTSSLDSMGLYRTPSPTLRPTPPRLKDKTAGDTDHGSNASVKQAKTKNFWDLQR